MRYSFRKLRKLWLLYLFLLFFAFFMFAISINVYLESLKTTDVMKRTLETRTKFRQKNTKSVVAHYIGSGNIFGNMTKNDYNSNNFTPIASEGALGRPVIIPAKESFKMQRLFKVNSFNILASDRIPLNRTLKDYRMKECRLIEYPDNLPTTSIIIVFHNEAWSVLLRTIWSVINRSPRSALKEILLIDDASDRDFLKTPLDDYVKALPVPTIIYRLKDRQGLVPARLVGANNAKGEVLTFLDAHCECSKGWLEPLLARIKENRNSVICPVIDIISDDNFGYTKTFENHWGAFNWQLSFRWYSLGRSAMEKLVSDVTKPIRTPAMAGGLFAIDKKYFFEIGSYDKEMKVWGGENVEMSFRIWQCGGLVEISPCSHVGHIFRRSTPYTFPGGMAEVLSKNLARAAIVWMDEWKDFFFLYNSVKMELRDQLDVTERLQIRQRLQCKPFSWYLKHIWPENFFPAEDRFFGKIIWLNGETDLSREYTKFANTLEENLKINDWTKTIELLSKTKDKLLNYLSLDKDNCLRSLQSNDPFASYALSPATVGDCNPDSKLQDMFVITDKGQIMTNENVCLDYFVKKERKFLNSTGTNVQLFQCFNDARQHWSYDIQNQHIIHQASKLCLTVASKTVDGKTSKIIEATDCQSAAISQKWGLITLPWKF